MEENLKQQHTDIIKIALVGPESTGKSTLARQLAKHFDTVWAPEFAREFLQVKWNSRKIACEPEDLLPIAYGQIKAENNALLTANKFLFCDTNLFVTKVFSELYYNFCDPVLDKAARKHKYDLFFLTDIDVPWEKDDLRDASQEREKTLAAFKNALSENNKPFIVLSGNASSRFKKAREIVENLVKSQQMGLTSQDFIQIYEKGISLEKIESHLNIFRNGIAKTILVRAATKRDGIIKLPDGKFAEYAAYFDDKKNEFKLKKFVPASGAASRMFKFLIEFLNEFDIENETINAYINRKKAVNLTVFLTGLEKFPFFDDVDKRLKALYPDFNSWERDKKNYYFIKLVLSPEHYDFCNKPKGILPFHKYPTHIATPIEEHLNESAFYAASNGIANLHFTISEAHQKHFESFIDNVKRKVESDSGTKINIKFTFQNPTTDTIAVGLDNKPFRGESGRLVFRPGGHGALLDNLNNLDADIVFIKNIDNVIQNHIESITLYKKSLAGILLEFQENIFRFLNKIENNSISSEDIEGIASFILQQLQITMIEDFPKYTLENKINYIKEVLNRPLRVCGMVKNEGEPGGGPFWVRDVKGNISLQIVEASQIDTLNPNQAQILKSSTHFNPVDIVCGIKDYRGSKFDLHEFVEHNSGFIVEKNKNGNAIKAYELPGLWNGAMDRWITLFVEVPLSTFNPVKTVNDLLKSAHQPQ